MSELDDFDFTVASWDEFMGDDGMASRCMAGMGRFTDLICMPNTRISYPYNTKIYYTDVNR